MNKYIVVLLALFLFYTRFIGLDWGLPFPMHPDERNMADAVVRLKCDTDSLQDLMSFINCYNPQFFAYGQLPLYMAYIFIKFWQVGALFFGEKIILNFPTATLGLRIVSATLSLLLTYVMWLTYLFLKDKVPETKGSLSISSVWFDILVLVLFIFQPYLIQYAHFGTTETTLMLLYVLTVYFSLRYIDRPSWKWISGSALMVGVAAATKISGILFGSVPFLALVYSLKGAYFHTLKSKASAFLRYGFTFILVFLLSYILSSPHNILSWKDFLGSMNYEIPVGNGSLLVFYTRQFINTIPYLFQFTHVFPYALGLPVFILSIIGFFTLPWNNPSVNILRFSWLVYFVVTGSLFIKWSRFMAPIMPLMTLFAVMGLIYICRAVDFERKRVKVCFVFLALVLLVPGIAYLTIYQKPDVRFAASKVIADTVSVDSRIFEEGGNVVNIPIPPPDSSFILPYYNFNAVDMYDITTDADMYNIQSVLDTSDVVIIPSRRIFASRTCLRPSDAAFALSDTLLGLDCEKLTHMYPYHQDYYSQIFSKDSNFIQIASISSYPRIEIFGKILLEFPDEFAEETWTVFDHPVIRIYKRVNPLN